MEDLKNVSVSTATLRPEDLIYAFSKWLTKYCLGNEASETFKESVLSVLETFSPVGSGELTQEKVDALCKGDYDYADYLLNEDLPDLFNQIAPEGYYFGSHPGNGSDFGFWLSEDVCPECEGHLIDQPCPLHRTIDDLTQEATQRIIDELNNIASSTTPDPEVPIPVPEDSVFFPNPDASKPSYTPPTVESYNPLAHMTHDLYWVCKCDNIHPNATGQCPVCQEYGVDSPDAPIAPASLIQAAVELDRSQQFTNPHYALVYTSLKGEERYGICMAERRNGEKGLLPYRSTEEGVQDWKDKLEEGASLGIPMELGAGGLDIRVVSPSNHYALITNIATDNFTSSVVNPILEIEFTSLKANDYIKNLFRNGAKANPFLLKELSHD